ncbi:hypothetical protein IQ250_12535, partial [Pseudanabaenaceae cyanobacterium LEGE 13415]|nr:hypothetical protein [Pseudanabaenaceae cyanobacterium LEGE 13415]
MGDACKCGSEQKPDAPSTFIIKVADITPRPNLPGLPRLFTRNVSDFQPETIYAIYEIQNTSEFCGRSPDSTAQSFPNKEINPIGYQMYRKIIYEKWGQYCRCKRCEEPPPFKGGQCPIRYNLEFKMTLAPGVLFGSAGQWDMVGKITSITVSDEPVFGRPGYRIIMQNEFGHLNSSTVYKTEGEPYDIRPVPSRPDEVDSCGDPPRLPSPDPLPPPPPPNLIAPPPPMIKPPPPPPKPCICPPPKVIEKERIVFRDRIVPRTITVIKKVKECCDLSPIIRRLDQLESNVKGHINVAAILQTKSIVSAIAGALLGQTAAIKAALTVQTAAILLGVSGLLATATGTITALIAVTEKKIVEELRKQIIITGNWIRNNLANTVINPGFERVLTYVKFIRETLGIVGEAIQRQNNEILKWVKFIRETLGIVGEAIQRQNNEILKWVKFTRETLGIVGEAIQRQNNEILKWVKFTRETLGIVGEAIQRQNNE